jgi:hypothetical protein
MRKTLRTFSHLRPRIRPLVYHSNVIREHHVSAQVQWMVVWKNRFFLPERIRPLLWLRTKICPRECLLSYKDKTQRRQCKGTLQQVFICLRPRTRVYSILIHTGRRERGRVEPERRLEGQHFTKLGRKYKPYWMYLHSINSEKHLPQSPFTDIFLDDDILLPCLLWTNIVNCAVS